jgi:protein-arginine kinase activator protein McsA
MRKIHGASLHRGKNLDSMVVDNDTQSTLPVKEEERVAEELRKAIEGEDFERAAELRDKLTELRESVITE